MAALPFIQVGQVFPGEFRQYGFFAIDASPVSQDYLIGLLTESDKKRIGDALGVTITAGTHFHLSPMAQTLDDLPPKPTFKSESGHDIWVVPSERTLRL
jgi:hypothetical protein